MNRVKLIFAVFYAFFLVFAVFYVKDVLKDGDLFIQDKPVVEKVKEIKPVNVKLIVDDNKEVIEYSSRLENQDSVLTLLEDLRQNKNFYFEIDSYDYGPEIVLVNNKITPQGYKWKLFYNSEDISLKLADVYLSDEAVYYLELQKL